MFVVRVFNDKEELINAHALTAKPTKVQIEKLIETFEGEYAIVEQRFYVEAEEQEGEQ